MLRSIKGRDQDQKTKKANPKLISPEITVNLLVAHTGNTILLVNTYLIRVQINNFNR